MSLFFNSGSLNITPQGPKSAAKVNNNGKIQLRFYKYNQLISLQYSKNNSFILETITVLKKVNKQLKSADIFYRILIQQKMVLVKLS